ncbi:putative molibdopterin-dependent oxidoreductase YjgC [Paraburkholderia bannensis]|uniref:Putative molibdopterin-dependent oxidoreductase YjgC n=1 Tax=Paraburkholderia bannensis TaxID=765414 RepID=A0A7W9U158_9BURK|nr:MULTISPECIES: 2Fe-2S iron-sulfur cluster-binding protein [Paraburkholderia]MBB3259001.1 putative molibdopterin-dependent oxidoreductase YjgC [Paraburkholderia sp. WP4_3_2]MBB6104015.1 putative molibdopterin-dependent oxidoreductase YjgC [Paraburkholderia bannensis]
MSEMLTLDVDGRSVQVARGSAVVAAIAIATGNAGVVTRESVRGAQRGPLCGMGVCQECRVTIDGVRHRLACQTLCAQGMDIRTARSAV